MPQTLHVDDYRFRALCARHSGFWEGADENSFLRATTVNAKSMPVKLPQSDGSYITHAERLETDMIDPAALIDEVEQWDPGRLDATLRVQGQYMVAVGTGDLLPHCSPLLKVPWPEAILGCPLKMTEGQIWDGHYPGDPQELIERGTNFAHNPWFQLYFEFARQLQDRLGDRFPLDINSYRGPSDLVAAVMGVQNACIAWIDEPAMMARLMRVCTDLLLTMIEAGGKLVRQTSDGYVGSWGPWAPQLTIGTQSDHSVLLSPPMYAQQILPYDREVLQSRPLSLFHLHSGGLHVAPILVEVPELDVIQVSMDPSPTSERPPREMEMLQLIHTHKSLMLWGGPFVDSESEELLAQFEPRRLCFVASFEPPAYEKLPADFPGRESWNLESK